MASLQDCKAVVFDLMGTCTDWHSALLPTVTALPPLEPPLEITPSDLLLQWRSGFFEEIHAQFERGDPAEDIDTTHRRVLDRILGKREGWSGEQRDMLVRGWHEQVGEYGGLEPRVYFTKALFQVGLTQF